MNRICWEKLARTVHAAALIWNTGARGVTGEMQLVVRHYREVELFIHGRIVRGAEGTVALLQLCDVIPVKDHKQSCCEVSGATTCRAPRAHISAWRLFNEYWTHTYIHAILRAINCKWGSRGCLLNWYKWWAANTQHNTQINSQGYTSYFYIPIKVKISSSPGQREAEKEGKKLTKTALKGEEEDSVCSAWTEGLSWISSSSSFASSMNQTDQLRSN